MGAEVASRKVLLLDGGMSSVAGFEAAGDAFMKDMTKVKLKIWDLKESRVSARGEGVRITQN